MRTLIARTIAGLAAVVLAIILVASLATAAKAEPPECYTIPNLPDQCMTAEVYGYVQATIEQRDRAIDERDLAKADDLDDQRRIGILIGENYKLTVTLWERNDQLRWAETMRKVAEDDLRDAYARIDTLRAKVRLLRALLVERRLS